MLSDKIIASKPYNKKFIIHRVEKWGSFIDLNEKDQVVSEINIFLSLIVKKSELKT